jgi:hypothetical protein
MLADLTTVVNSFYSLCLPETAKYCHTHVHLSKSGMWNRNYKRPISTAHAYSWSHIIDNTSIYKQ